MVLVVEEEIRPSAQVPTYCLHRSAGWRSGVPSSPGVLFPGHGGAAEISALCSHGGFGSIPSVSESMLPIPGCIALGGTADGLGLVHPGAHWQQGAPAAVGGHGPAVLPASPRHSPIHPHCLFTAGAFSIISMHTGFCAS